MTTLNCRDKQWSYLNKCKGMDRSALVLDLIAFCGETSWWHIHAHLLLLDSSTSEEFDPRSQRDVITSSCGNDCTRM
ncbi:predicted protein [Botrytis cinerea T4]|uniref:Uncharacterized protein n=1 Tax=Botryotinia fuckeliana (strain T4) TaxID=999810 RepID=G2Y7K0_BOTF4|nr:predicted protein [Botrytis cinerea T4]